MEENSNKDEAKMVALEEANAKNDAKHAENMAKIIDLDRKNAEQEQELKKLQTLVEEKAAMEEEIVSKIFF